MASRRSTFTLTNADCSLRISQPRPWFWVGIVLLFASLGVFAYSKIQPESPAGDLMRNATRLASENLNLRTAIERAQLEVRHEMATRNELENQVKQLTEQVKHLQDELTFMRSQKQLSANKN